MTETADALRAAPDDHPVAAILPPLLLMFADQREASVAALGPVLTHPDPWVRAAGRLMRIAVAENEGDVAALRRDAEASVAEWTALGDGWGVATALATRGQLRTMDGDLRGAAEDLGQALQQVAELGSTNDHVMISMRLADLRLRAGQPDEARKLMESMTAAGGYGRGELLRQLMSTIVGASIAMYEGDEPALRRTYDDLTAFLASLGEPTQFQAHGGAVAEAVAAVLAVRLGRLETARKHLGAGHEQALLTQDRPIMATVAVAVAHWLRAVRSSAEAARMLGIGARLRGSDDSTSLLIAALTEELRARLGDEFDRRYAEGLALDPAEAVSIVDPARYDTSPAGALIR